MLLSSASSIRISLNMLSYCLEFAGLLVRWLHLIAGVAWIGASFYFIWLDNSLRPPKPGSIAESNGVAGELWAVHGGGFYNPQKYLVSPPTLPTELHWFKWEAYTTWLSGMGLLAIVYWARSSVMMVDHSVADLAGWQAVAIGAASLIGGLVVYEGLCRSPLVQRPLAFGIVLFALSVALAWGLTHWLGGRAAFIHVGATLGTIMVANVFHIIIPGQKRMVAAMQRGERPAAIDGIRGKQRSVHNNYLTLPVLFTMISNHFALIYQHADAWALFGLLAAGGVAIRHFFNRRHKGHVEWRWPVTGVALLLVMAVWAAPRTPAPSASAPATSAPTLNDVRPIIAARCIECHAAQPTFAGFAQAPAGVVLTSDDAILREAARIHQQVVVLKAMPIGNLTGITDAERDLIARWFAAGAK
ncbi:urate hydroxylase PuuD [soil metagenome]